MKFSYKANKFLTLQKERGPFWVDKLGATGPVNRMTMDAVFEKKFYTWHQQSGVLFKDIFNVISDGGKDFTGRFIGKVENLFFCNEVVKTANDWIGAQSHVGFEKAIAAIVGKHNFFGSIILDNHRSIVFGIYCDKIIAVTLQDDLISNVEAITEIADGRSDYSSLLKDFVDRAESENDLSLMSYDIETTSPFLALIPLLVIYFFSQVETFVIQNSKNKKYLLNKDKFLNETEVPVKIIDSRWFRNIIRLEGFAVRGHFRLQPKKVNGEWTKELIWINDFEKHGYTSKARILNQDSTNE
jgi:hypothetical protein